MPRGQPDFGTYAVKETVSSLADVGELAARLGSIVTYDRRGDVIWFDDFENDLSAWYEAGTGTNHDAYVDAHSARNGAFSCKLVTGSGGYGTGMIVHLGGGLVLSKVGLEVSWTLRTTLDQLRLHFLYYDGETEYDYRIRWDKPSSKLQYYNTVPDFVPFTPARTLTYNEHLYHTLKFVMDLPNKKYGRVILDNVTYDLSDYSVRTRDSTTPPKYELSIATQVIADSNVTSFIDDVIITQNEP